MCAARSDSGRKGDLQRIFLLGIDLEDVRSMIDGGDRYRERVPENTRRLLDFFSEIDARCTFFTVGDVARRYPELIREVAERGHELACHSSDHTPLDRQDRASFRRDLEQNLKDLERAGIRGVKGFRAPVLSLTGASPWAHDVLAELGFDYSSSVYPATSPMYGWPGFGDKPRRMASRVWEIPVSLSGIPGLDVPFTGGVYFRLLPFPIIRMLFERRLSRGDPVVGYLHPFDIDTKQERFMHPELGGNRLKNHLMYVNRRTVLSRLETLAAGGTRIIPYSDYVAQLP